MGNGQTKYGAPTTVLTVVLAGGRIEKYEGPMLVHDLMLLHPRHHVVTPDFFRCSPVIVLRPEEVLMPGDRFFLVPCHTVYKKLLRRVEFLTRTFSSGGQSPTGNGHSRRVHQTGAVPDSSKCQSVRTSCSSGLGKKGSAGGSPVTRSPTGRTPSALSKSSPARSPQARKSPLRKEKGLRNHARRRASTNLKDCGRRTSLLSQMRKHDESSTTEVQENESLNQSADSTKLESSQSADLEERSTLEPSILITRLAALLELADPEDESFKTPIMRSPEQAEDSFESAATSPVQEPEPSSETMDSSDSDYSASAKPPPVSPGCAPGLGMAPERMDSQGGHCGQGEKSSSEPSLPTAPTVSGGCASILGIVSTGTDSLGDDSGLGDCRTRKESLSRLHETGTTEWKPLEEMLKLKFALSAQRTISRTDRHAKQLISQEPKRSLLASGDAMELHRGRHLGQQPPSQAGEKQLVSQQEPERSLTTKGKPPPQQQGSRTEIAGLQELQAIYRGPDNTKFVVRPVENDVFKRIADRHQERDQVMGRARQPEPRTMKLIEFLELDLSPLQDEKNCEQRIAMTVKDVPLPRRFEQFPTPHESIRTEASPGQELEPSQLNNAFNTQCDPTVRRPSDVNQMFPGTPSGDRLLRVPPGPIFRRTRRIRRRTLYTSVNWKPALKPVIEISP